MHDVQIARFRRWGSIGVALTAVAFATGSPTHAQPQNEQGAPFNVLTQHNNSARTGANLFERNLNVSNVNVDKFGRLFTRRVDGEIYAQPLYVASVPIPNKGFKNCIYVATEHNSVYCFDADDPAAAAPYWKTSFINPFQNINTVKVTEVGQACGQYKDMSTEIGITGTPVIDYRSATLYVVVMTKEVDKYFQRLHALDIRTGKERSGSPVTITATYTGTGEGNDRGVLTFDPHIQNQRPGLLLLNGVVYIAWASFCDTGPYHGWVMGYDARTLKQVAVWNATPNGARGGIWQSGQGLVADEEDNIYFATGNGTYNENANFGDSVMKLRTDFGGLNLFDWFTPSNQAALEAADADLNSCGPLYLQEENLILMGSKEGKLYSINPSEMGQYEETNNDNQIQQWFWAFNGHLHGSLITWQSPIGRLIYGWSEGDALKAFLMQDGYIQESPIATGSTLLPGGDMPGGILSLSADAGKEGTGVLWATHAIGNANQEVRPGIFRAYDAVTLQELWNSEDDDFRDRVGMFAKFCPPTVANGKVYLATFSTRLDKTVYGLHVYGQVPPEIPQPDGYRINTGGGGVGNFTKEAFAQGGSLDKTSQPISTEGVANAGPAALYQSWRMGVGGEDFSYVLPGLTRNAKYRVRLHFAEPVWNQAGRRRFNVRINGAPFLLNFDIFKQAGARYKAVVREFTVTSSKRGRIVIDFQYAPFGFGRLGNPLVCGIEVAPVK